MKARILAGLALIGAFAWAGDPPPAPTLAGVLNLAKAEWLMGTWEGSTDNGSVFTHSFNWDLNQRIIQVRGKAGEVEYMGVIALDPDTKEAVYAGYDNQGTVSKGVWREVSGAVVLKLESNHPERGKRSMGVSFTRSGTGTGDDMQIGLHRVEADGTVVQPAAGSIAMKRTKPPANPQP